MQTIVDNYKMFQVFIPAIALSYFINNNFSNNIKKYENRLLIEKFSKEDSLNEILKNYKYKGLLFGTWCGASISTISSIPIFISLCAHHPTKASLNIHYVIVAAWYISINALSVYFGKKKYEHDFFKRYDDYY